MAISLASFSCLSLRSLPEPLLLVAGLPAHCAHPATCRYQGAFASSYSFVNVLPQSKWNWKGVDFFRPLRMMGEAMEFAV